VSRLPLVLAIEPDLRQAAIVKRVVKERVQADIVVVDSRDAAIAAINAAVPDVVLVSMLLSPRDEDDLIAHLRTLEGGAHLQTHTIPQLASALGRGEDGGGGLFSSFRRKKQAASAPAGCDPDLFADEIRLYLQRAAEKKQEAAETGAVTPHPALGRRPAEAAPSPAPAEEEAAPAPGSAWSSPFEWRPSADRRAPQPAEPVQAESPIPDPPAPILDPQSPIPDLQSLIAEPEPEMAELEALSPDPRLLVPDPQSLDADLLASPPAADSPVLPPTEYTPAPPPTEYTPAPPPPVHTPAPLSVWARKETAANDAHEPDAEFAALFARLGMPEGVASVTYPDGVRIRRVRVRPAKEGHHASLSGAVLMGKRMLAELSGTDTRA
jgi:hypothetical protein